MDKYQVFRTLADAEKEIATMKGWRARAVRLTGIGWVLECRDPAWSTGRDPAYLRADGYIK